jgi:hypothetical protein
MEVNEVYNSKYFLFIVSNFSTNWRKANTEYSFITQDNNNSALVQEALHQKLRKKIGYGFQSV